MSKVGNQVIAAADGLASTASVAAKQLVTQIVEDVPFYRLVPAEQLDGDICEIIKEHLLRLPVLLRAGRPPAERELARAMESAAARAEEGVPLALVIKAYVFATNTVLNEILDRAGPIGPEESRAVYDFALEFLHESLPYICQAHHEASEIVGGAQVDARTRTVSSLLRGDVPDPSEGRPGIRIASEYVVLWVSMAPHSDESSDPRTASIAARRKLRRVALELDATVNESVLTSLDTSGGVVLLPMDREPFSVASPRDAVQLLVDRLNVAAGAQVRAGASMAAPSMVHEAARESREVLEVADTLGLEANLYLLEDVLVEYQLSRESRATAALSQILTPLLAKPELVETLRVHIANDLNRRRTAETLFIHPNTVDYRLRRIADLTGHDVTRPRDAQRLLAALAARPAA